MCRVKVNGLDGFSKVRIGERIQQAYSIVSLSRQMKPERLEQHQVRQMPGSKRTSWPSTSHLSHHLLDTPTYCCPILRLVQVNERGERSKERPRLARVYLKACAGKREITAALMDNHLARSGAAEHVLRLGRMQRQVTRENEGPAARQDDAVFRREPHRFVHAFNR